MEGQGTAPALEPVPETEAATGRRSREKQASVRIQIFLNPQEAICVDRLLETGLWGLTREQVVRRLFDHALYGLLMEAQQGRGLNV